MLLPGGKGSELLYTNYLDGTISYGALTATGTSVTNYMQSLNYGSNRDSCGYGYGDALFNALNTPSGVDLRAENIIAAGDVGSPASTADVAAVWSKSISATDAPGCIGNKLTITQLKRTPAEWNNETPQYWGMIFYRYNVSTNALPPLCYRFTVKTPTNLADVIYNPGSRGWMEIFAIKGTLDNANTQHRLSIVLNRENGESGIRVYVRFDLFNKDMNGNDISGGAPTLLWGMLSDEGAIVPGNHYDFYLYFDQRNNRADLTGLTEILVIDKTTNIVAFQDSKTGVPTCGYDQANGGRIFFYGLYTGGFPSSGNIVMEYSGCQIWDSMPLHISRYTYNRAKFYAPLRGSLALTNGTGSATFTRATACWEFNDEGKLVSIPSGAVRMRGYRPVVNWFVSPNDMVGSASWIVGNASKSAATGPDGVTSDGCLWTVTTGSGNNIRQSYTPSNIGGSGYKAIRIRYKPGTSQWVLVYVYLDGSNRILFWCNLTTHAVGTVASGGTFSLISVSINLSADYPGWYEINVVYVSPTSGSAQIFQVTNVDADNSAAQTLVTGRYVTFAHPQLTATDYITEYVSGDNGAGANGVKYFATYKDGTPIPEANLLGAGLNPNQIINTLLYCRDLTNAAWTKTNVTAALTQTGIDGQANACTLLTATAADGTALQTITAAAAAACSGFYVKRSVGSGSVYFTRDGGTNWTDITSLINNSAFTFVKIENTSVTNPQVGFKIATSGDAIIVDAGINHLGTKIASCPILTTSASVTVNAETLTYPTTSNIDNLQGSILATFTADSYSSGMGNIVGSSTAGLATSSSYTCQAKDGTNTVNGSAASPSGTIKIGMAWESTFNVMHAIGENGVETSGTYDGSLGLSTIAILPSADGYVKDVACFSKVLSNSEVQSVFNS